MRKEPSARVGKRLIFKGYSVQLPADKMSVYSAVGSACWTGAVGNAGASAGCWFRISVEMASCSALPEEWVRVSVLAMERMPMMATSVQVAYSREEAA